MRLSLLLFQDETCSSIRICLKDNVIINVVTRDYCYINLPSASNNKKFSYTLALDYIDDTTLIICRHTSLSVIV